jgi:hypothetical protein
LKKKLSLSEYNKMKKTNTPSLSKATSNASNSSTAVVKPLLSTVEEIACEGIKDGSAVVDVPMTDVVMDPTPSLTSENT